MALDLMVIYLIISFLVGGIPFGLIIGKVFCHKDIRKEGSGNIGATNAARVLNIKYAAFTFLMDGFKSFIMVLPAKMIFGIDFSACVLFFVTIGHIFSIWLKGKGGKGISSTMLGLMAFDYRLSLLMIAVWHTTFFITKISALAALTSIVVVIVFSYFLLDSFCFYIILLIGIFAIFAHRENLKRLLDGKELGFEKKKEKEKKEEE